MKKNFKYLPFLAALAFVGCSNDDTPVDNVGGGEGSGYGYVAVNIMSSAGTRAETGFVDGSDTENKAKDGVFFIFNEEGTTRYGDAQRLTFTGTDTESDQNIEKLYSGVLVIDGKTEDPSSSAKQIVCVLNAPVNMENDNTLTTLSALTAKVEDYLTNKTTEGTFIMTNSVYNNAQGATVVGAPITKIYNSAAEAYAAPVDIYVERAVAKIKVSKAAADFTNTDVKIPIDGTETTLKIRPTGVALVSLADKAYLLKNLTGYSSTDWTWNAADKFRSYWEVVPEIGTEDPKLNFTTNDKTYSGTNGISVENFDMSSYTGFEQYVLPNTVAETTERPTALVMTAKLQKSDGSDIDANNPLAYIRGGYTYSDTALEVVGKHLAAAKNYYMRSGSEGSYTYVPFDKTGLEWKNGAGLSLTTETMTTIDLKRYEVIAQVKNNVKVYNADGTEVSDGATVVNDYLKSAEATNYQARVFTNGMCYYWVYVNHTQTSTSPEMFLPGVVRNHVYDLSLTSVSGLGVPVFNASDVIIPEKVEDETTYYLGAKVNVLAWRAVATQNVEF